MSAMDNIREHAGRAHKNLGSSPLIMWLLAGLVLLLWACGTVTQISTSEYMAMGNGAVVTNVQWNVFLQPWQLLTGQAPLVYRTAWMYGWIVECLTLVVALGLSAALIKIGSLNGLLARLFLIASLVLLLLNSVADYSASPGSGLVKFLIALALGLIVTAGLPLGIGLLEYGCEQY